jgi:hypothetical protein
VHHVAVHCDRLDRAPRGVQHGSARRLVDAARAQPDEAVLDHVDAPDPVRAGELVEAVQQARRRERRAVDRRGAAVLEADQDLGRRVGRLLGRPREQEHALVGRAPRVLEDSALVRDVHQVAVHRVGLRERRGHRDAVLLRVGDAVGPRHEVPLAPRRDDRELGCERAERELEAHLVVALAGRAVRDRVAAGLACDLGLVLGDQRPRERGAEQVAALVDRRARDRRIDEVAHELLAHVAHDAVDRAGRACLLGQAGELLLLADVGGERDHLAFVLVDQPVQDHRRIEPAAVGQTDALHRAPRHIEGSSESADVST